MKKISKCTAGVGMLIALLFTINQTIAVSAEKDKSKDEPPPGTWIQQGVDLNGDGILSGEESERVIFFDGDSTNYISFTLHVEGKCLVDVFPCRRIDGNIGTCGLTMENRFEPGTKQRIQREIFSSYGFFGIRCLPDCIEECAFTVTDVRP